MVVGEAPPNSLEDLNASPKMKTTEGVKVHSFARNTSGVRGMCWNFGMGTKLSDKQVNYSY